MDIINISNWTNKQVLDWFGGLDSCLEQYVRHFEEADVVGEQLLSLTHEDLNSLQIHLIGHQELILDAVSLLQQLDDGLDAETLQSRALSLKCRCRRLRSSIAARRKETEEYEYEGGVSLQRGATNQMLHLAAEVLSEGKQLVLWLDRAPFNARSEFKGVRHGLVKLCYELSVTMQQSVFACVIEDAALSICTEIENSADGIVQSNDSLTIQPVNIEQILLKDVDPQEGLGLFIKVTFEGHHVVTGTRAGSVAAKAKRIVSGDEVVAVNGKAVIGWSLGSLVLALKERPTQVSLLLKKRPQSMPTTPSSNILSMMQRQELNERSRQLRAPAPVKRISLPASSRTPIDPAQMTRDHNGAWSGVSNDHHGDTSLDTHSYVVGHDQRNHYRQSVNSIESYNSSSNTRYSFSSNSTGPGQSTPQDRSRQSSWLRGSDAASAAGSLKVEPSSPIDILSIPPPPPEPYTPKDDPNKLRVIVDHVSRAESPNSMLDIEHQRRYTVIGSSDADQAWFEGLITQVNRCSIPTSSGRSSQDQISSVEDVFSTPPHSSTSSVAKGNSTLPEEAQAFTSYRRYPRHSTKRPVSMPPNYYDPVRRHQPSKVKLKPLNSTLQANVGSCRLSSSHAEDPYRLRYSSKRRLPATPTHQAHPTSSQNLRDSGHSGHYIRQSTNNSNNNNNNSNNNINTSAPRAFKFSGSTERKNSDCIPVSRTTTKQSAPPKPPPRSSSITKLSHRHSAEIASFHGVNHPRQASLPSNTALTTMATNSSQTAQQKPTIPEKPSGLHSLLNPKSSAKRPKVSERSTSTPTLLSTERKQDSLPNSDRSATVDSSSSPNVKKPRSDLIEKGLDARARASPVKKQPPPPPPTKRPVPKPRKNIRRNKSVDLHSHPDATDASSRPRLTRSQSQDTALDDSPCRETRRTANSSESDKTDWNPIGQITPPGPNAKAHHDYVNQEQRLSPEVKKRVSNSPARSSPSRVSYTAAIESSSDAEQVVVPPLMSRDVPQLNDSYELKVVAGVPVRLRKSLPRSAISNKKKDQLGKSPSNNFLSADMRSQRRISCRDLGRGDCEGWLWKKKSAGTTAGGSGPLSQKWSKRWVVIKEGGVYCYRSNAEDDDSRADCYISLPGYTVAPAPECKRKFAFRIWHQKRKTFFFAAERQSDMSKWMNKMGLASIEYQFGPGDGTRERCKDTTSSKGDNEYYSESDEESRSAGDRSSTDLDRSFSTPESSPEKKDRLLSSTQDKVPPRNGDVIVNKTDHHALRHNSQSNRPISVKTNGHLRSQSGSGLVKKEPNEHSELKSPSSPSVGSSEQVTSYTPSSPSRMKPSVTSNQRRHKGDSRRMLTKKLSKSLDSLTTDADLGNDGERIKKVKEVAAVRAEDVRRREKSLPSSPIIRVSGAQPEQNRQSGLAALFQSKRKKKRKSTSALPRHDFLNDRPASSADIDARSDSSASHQQSPRIGPKHSSSSPALSILATAPPPSDRSSSNLSQSRRDAVGRPKLSPGNSPTIPRSLSTPVDGVTPSKSAARSAAETLNEELTSSVGMDDMFCAIKKADVDFRGLDRRTTLRRKMTVLSRDPIRNEKMLRKRALHRELKAKEQELEYLNDLLSKSSITSESLHEWINQHPSLVADMGTIRRMSKRKRPRLPALDNKSTEGGDAEPATENAKFSGVFSVTSSDDVTSPVDEASPVDVANSNNNNNNNNVEKSLLNPGLRRTSSRPRSWAISEADVNGSVGSHRPTPDQTGSGKSSPKKRHSLNPPSTYRKSAHRLSSSPVLVTSSNEMSPSKPRASHRRISSNRQMQKRGGSESSKPYLETDL